MSIVISSFLNSPQKSAVKALVDSCRKKDRISLSFPFEEASLFLLDLEEDGSARAACAFTCAGEELYECSAFTAPDCRRQGRFSRLLNMALEQLPEESELLFCCDERCPDTREALSALGAQYDSCEHMMEYTPKEPEIGSALFSSVSVTEPEPGLFLYESPFGRLTISKLPDFFYLYGFEIHPEFRGQGRGMELLSCVLSDLWNRAPLPVRLQVSGENKAALSLYEKTGFHITETLSCYLY